MAWTCLLPGTRGPGDTAPLGPAKGESKDEEDIMASDLAQHIQNAKVIDTHEHMKRETHWVNKGPADVLEDLFANYVPADLRSAGATAEASAEANTWPTPAL